MLERQRWHGVEIMKMSGRRRGIDAMGNHTWLATMKDERWSEKMQPPSEETSVYTLSEDKTDWKSVCVGAVVSFLIATQFSIYFTSLWPYLLQLEPNATETFFGYITAIYSLGQALASPAFGYWANRINQTKFPSQVGVMLTIIGNILYLMLPLQLLKAEYLMMISRLIMGIGGGVIGVLRTSAVAASIAKDRSRVISMNTGAFSLGLTLGPGLQMIFTPLSYPGVHLFGSIYLNVYTGPAFSGCVVNLICMTLLHFLYRESDIGLHKIQPMENESHERFFALPKFDWIAAGVCIYARFAQMFVITNLETIGSPLSMTMFAWNKEEAVFYNSVMNAAFAMVGFLIYALNTIFNIGSRLNHRVFCIVGLLLIVLFHLLTYPWPFLTTKIKYQEPDPFNLTEPVGCRTSFHWCSEVPAINVYLYIISYVVLISTAFALITVTMNTVYSMVIGPRNQGFMQGLLVFTGSCARLSGPIIVSSTFTNHGPGVPWIVEIFVSLSCVVCWIIFYRRLVPLKMNDDRLAGEKFRNKYGTVYKF